MKEVARASTALCNAGRRPRQILSPSGTIPFAANSSGPRFAVTSFRGNI